jgi:hypothetical protein
MQQVMQHTELRPSQLLMELIEKASYGNCWTKCTFTLCSHSFHKCEHIKAGEMIPAFFLLSRALSFREELF